MDPSCLAADDQSDARSPDGPSSGSLLDAKPTRDRVIDGAIRAPELSSIARQINGSACREPGKPRRFSAIVYANIACIN